MLKIPTFKDERFTFIIVLVFFVVNLAAILFSHQHLDTELETVSQAVAQVAEVTQDCQTVLSSPRTGEDQFYEFSDPGIYGKNWIVDALGRWRV